MSNDTLTHNSESADEMFGNSNAVVDDMERLQKLQRWWRYARSVLAEQRREALIDHEFYDGIQWDEDDANELRNRGQIPLVFNRIKPAIKWILGTEKKTRVDYRVLPRTADDAKAAETKLKILKYLSDVNHVQEERSQAFKDAVISGIGWIETGVISEPEEEPIFTDYEDWRNIWLDPLSVRPDIKDARFIFRRKRVDLDVACGMFPEHTTELKASAITALSYSSDDYLSMLDDADTDYERIIEEQGGYSGYDISSIDSRMRVELVECWYRTPQKIQILRHGTENIGTLNGVRYQDAHKDIVSSGYATVTDAIRMMIRYSVFTGNTLLIDTDSPYNHNRFPFIPIVGERRKRDNTPYGVVRNLRDPQMDLNKRHSKALWILSTQQIVADDDAVDDWDELADEATRPDGIIKKKRGAELSLEKNRDLAEEHIALMQNDSEYIESTSGVTDEQMGRATNAVSGTAIQARQTQGQTTTSDIFDNLRVAIQSSGEILLSLVEQFYTDEKIIRITNDKGKTEFEQINSIDSITGESLNDITASQADFIVDSSTWNSSVRQAVFDQMMELAGKLDPQVALNMLDLIIDLSDIPGKDDFVSRIREMNGHGDPDADPNDPEEIVKQQAIQQAEQQKSEREQLIAKLEMDKAQSEINKNNATAAATTAGMEHDKERLRIEKAKALHDIRMRDMPESKANERKQQLSKTKSKDRIKPTERGEYGIASDNKEK